MTKAILYILFFAYSINLVKPVLPYISDTVSHILWYSEHISTVHYENGNSHVHVQAMIATKKTQMPSPANPGKSDNSISEHLTATISYQFPQKSFADHCFPNLSSLLCDLITTGDYPPPRI